MRVFCSSIAALVPALRNATWLISRLMVKCSHPHRLTEPYGYGE
jgi:hypothetical protein